MSYRVIVAPDAFDGLKYAEGGIELGMLSCILDHLKKLGDDPVGLGRKPLVPLPDSGQNFPFHCLIEGTKHFLVAVFSYAESEDTINILRIRYQRTTPL